MLNHQQDFITDTSVNKLIKNEKQKTVYLIKNKQNLQLRIENIKHLNNIKCLKKRLISAEINQKTDILIAVLQL